MVAEDRTGRTGEADTTVEGSILSRRHFLGAVGGGAALVTGLGSLPALASRPGGALEASGSTATVAVFQNPDTLDPSASGLVSSGEISNHVFDPLIWVLPHGRGRKYYPGLAHSFHVSPDASTYTFHLKKGVHFHDGTEFDAHAVKTTFDHIIDPRTKSRGAAASLGPHYKETRILNKYTAQVVFSQPNASFADYVGGFSMISPAALKKYGIQGFGKHPVGTGPFKFKQWVDGESVTLERNPKYHWGPAPLGNGHPAKLISLVFRILSDHSAQYNALQTGEITLAENLDPQDVTALAGNSRYHKFVIPATGMPYNFMINTQKFPTNDVRVRRAMEYATNQAQIVKTLFYGLYTPANSVYGPTVPGYSKKQAMYHYDPKEAAHLLDAAGWKIGSGGVRSKHGKQLKLDLINIAGFGFDGISQLLQAQFKAVGIATTISDQSFPAVAATYNKGAQHLADFFYYDPDPYFTHALFACSQVKSGFNWGHYCNPKLDAMVNKANTIVNAAKRNKLYEAVGNKLMEDAVIIPIYNLRSVYVGLAALKGVQFTLAGTPLLHRATV